MSAHPSPEELLARLAAAAEEDGGSLESLTRHRALAEACPALTPNLLHLGRALQRAEPAAGEDTFEEAERVLRGAVEVSGREPRALVELGWFLDSVRNAPARAEPLLEEGATRALHTLEDAWAGLLQALAGQGKRAQALALAERAQRTFPDSARIAEAVGLARALTSESEG